VVSSVADASSSASAPASVRVGVSASDVVEVLAPALVPVDVVLAPSESLGDSQRADMQRESSGQSE